MQLKRPPPTPAFPAARPPTLASSFAPGVTAPGLTQEGLAHSLSVTFSTVSRWENGHVLPSRLAWRALQQLAAERGCPLVETQERRPGLTGQLEPPTRRVGTIRTLGRARPRDWHVTG